MSQSIRVVEFSDYLCPWCYPAAARLEKIRRQFPDRLAVRWHPFALRPEPNQQPFEFKGSYVERAWQAASLMSEGDAIRYHMWDQGPYPRWSLPGLFAGAAALRQGEEAFHRFHPAMFEAFFSHNEDITQKETAVEVARRAALDLDAFLRDYDHPTIRESVRKAVREAYETHRITAVPTVIINGQYRLEGAVPQAQYWKALAECGLEVDPACLEDSGAVVSRGWVDLGDVGPRQE
jgi:predicted DsbA family dithiol-disulfide isomerase